MTCTTGHLLAACACLHICTSDYAHLQPQFSSQAVWRPLGVAGLSTVSHVTRICALTKSGNQPTAWLLCQRHTQTCHHCQSLTCGTSKRVVSGQNLKHQACGYPIARQPAPVNTAEINLIYIHMQIHKQMFQQANKHMVAWPAPATHTHRKCTNTHRIFSHCHYVQHTHDTYTCCNRCC
jgi:hypothetical protein